VQRVPEPVLHDRFGSAPDSRQKIFAALLLSYAAGEVIDTTGTLRRVRRDAAVGGGLS
jgi:hypothetical protein